MRKTTRALVWLLRHEGFFSLCYLDDFVGLESSRAKAEEAYERFTKLTQELGLELAKEKCTPPATSTKWLGFILDIVAMSITLPKDKLNEVIDDCKQWAHKKTASRKQIQSLAGKLQHVTKCIKPAARFTNRILAVLRETPYKGQHSLRESYY